MESWSLLGRWDIKACVEALKKTLVDSGMSSRDANNKCKKFTEYMKYEPRFIIGYEVCSPFDRYHLHNVIVIGNIGAGKSSVINMLLGTDHAAVSSGPRVETSRHAEYRLQYQSNHYMLHDTPGLTNPIITAEIFTAKTIYAETKNALQTLCDLVAHLEGGVHLLLYVVRGPRIEDRSREDYRLFKEAICGGNVPICLVVTGLEYEDSPEQWWNDNKGNFDNLGMGFNGQACITATKGRKLKNGERQFAEMYEDSTKKVEKLLGHCLPRGWSMPREPSVATTKGLGNLFAQAFGAKPPHYTELTKCLIDYGLTHDDALEITTNIG